jgi:hypothetical protein
MVHRNIVALRCPKAWAPNALSVALAVCELLFDPQEDEGKYGKDNARRHEAQPIRRWLSRLRAQLTNDDGP